MKDARVLLISAATALLLGLAAPALALWGMGGPALKNDYLKVDLDDHFRTANYDKLQLSSVDCNWFLGKIKAIKNYDRVADEVQGLNADVKNKVEIFVDKYIHPRLNPGAHTLTLQVLLSDYRSGSTAGALFLGTGAGSGYCTYMVRLFDGRKELARFETTAPIVRAARGIGGASASADRSRAQIPDRVVMVLRQFLSTH